MPAFDGVRGLAEPLDVSSHARLFDESLYAGVLPKHGSLGVDVFLVLSGFRHKDCGTDPTSLPSAPSSGSLLTDGGVSRVG